LQQQECLKINFREIFGASERYEGLWRSPLPDHFRTRPCSSSRWSSSWSRSRCCWRERLHKPATRPPIEAALSRLPFWTPSYDSQLRCRFAVAVIPRFIAAIRRVYATARTCNGRTYPNRGLCHAAEALLVWRSVRTSIAHGRCIMRNHDLVSDGFLTLIAASLVLLGSSLLAFAIV
jgi:hypothetical protein